ncbi:hypothetical protein D3C74_469960 [compost metagenome]
MNIKAFQEDRRIIATKLKCHILNRFRSSFDNMLSCFRSTCKGDLRNMRIRSQFNAHIRITMNDIDYTSRELTCNNLGHFRSSQWRKWTGFQHNRVARK